MSLFLLRFIYMHSPSNHLHLWWGSTVQSLVPENHHYMEKGQREWWWHILSATYI